MTAREPTKDLGHELLVELADYVAPDRHHRQVLNLTSLARHIGAYDVVYRARTAHGFTDWTARGPRIVLGWAATEGRRRALLAHECGHLLLDPHIKPSEQIGSSVHPIPEALRDRILGVSRSISLERLCDDFAYELVFPDQLAERIAPRISSIESLSRFRDALGITMSVAVIKLNHFRELAGLPALGVLQAQRTSGAYWLASSSCGMSVRWRGRIEFPKKTGWMLDSMQPGELRNTTVGLSGDEGTVYLAAQVQKYKDRATLMISASDAAIRPRVS